MSTEQTAKGQFVALSQEHYAHEVRQVLADLTERDNLPLEDAVFRCHGAFPTVPLFLSLGKIPRSPTTSSMSPHLSTPWRTAEGDLLLSEWYFTQQTTIKLVKMFPAVNRQIVAVGCPTVAVEAAKTGTARIALIDASPWVSLTGENIDHRTQDVGSLTPEAAGEATFFIDPPWHLDDYKSWLGALSPRLAPGSRVCLVLPEQLSSRASRAIRSFSIDFFAARGVLDIIHDAVDYETPEFEAAMLRTAGLPVRDWRSGDILDVRINTVVSGGSVPTASSLPSQWMAFNFSGRVVRLKTPTVERSTHFRFDSGDDSGHWTLPDPSRSRIRNSGIDCVTSAGIALRIIEGSDLLSRTLLALQEGLSVTQAIRSLRVSDADSRRLQEVCNLLLDSSGDEDGA